jgi:hypothetical protein
VTTVTNRNSQPSHYELGQQIGRLATILEPLPERLDKFEEKMDNDIRELRAEISSLKEARSHLVGIGVGIGATFTFLAGLIAAAANGALKWIGLTH